MLRYDGFMDFSLHIVWKAIPEAMVASAEKSDGGLEFLNNWGWMYTIIVSTVLGALAGLSIKLLGNPGDLPDVINCVHKEGYVPIQQTLPMIFCSLFSIAAGGSLGPEAPLVAISSSTCGWLSMHYFMHDPVMVRKCTIIGMSAGLSAFFGVQLGGELENIALGILLFQILCPVFRCILAKTCVLLRFHYDIRLQLFSFVTWWVHSATIQCMSSMFVQLSQSVRAPQASAGLRRHFARIAAAGATATKVSHF